MKKFVFMILFILGMNLITGCEKDGIASKDNLLGDWDIWKVEEFDRDGELEDSYEDFVPSAFSFTKETWTLRSQEYFGEPAKEDAPRTYSYTYDETLNVLLLLGIFECKVLKMTKTELVFTIPDGLRYYWGDGYTVVYCKKH